MKAAVASTAGISLHYNADRENEKNELFIHTQRNLDGLTAITCCLSSVILFEHKEDLQHVYFVKVGLDLFLISKGMLSLKEALFIGGVWF